MAEPWDVRVDRTDRTPLHIQLAAGLEQAILDGRLPPGSRLPNEVDLAEQLDLSRPTVRQAIARLVDGGLVVRKRGVGTQVVGRPVRRPLALSSLHDDLSETGREPTTVVRLLETIPVPADVAGPLQISPDTPVVFMRRLRYAQGQPLALMSNYLPAHLVEAAGLTAPALEAEGLYKLLRDAGIRLRVARQTIGAQVATPPIARELDEPDAAPLLSMIRIAYDDAGNAVEYGKHLYRANRYSFELTMVER